MFRFGNPEAFQYLWLVPVLVGLYVFAEIRGRRRLRKSLGERVTPFLISSYSQGKRRFKLALRLVALVFFVLALARPQFGTSPQKVKSEGIELMIAFDVSTSMLAEDVKPSRMEQAKAEVSRLLDMLAGDKVGLVAFAGSSVLISPLTSDKAALKMFLDSLSTNSVETQGTELMKALREARAAFDRGGIEPDETTRVTRVILFVSDGEDHEPGAMEEARKLAGEGIRVFSLAVGTERGERIPIRDERGYIRGYKHDRQGREVITKTKGTVLKELAEVGKGSFYSASFGGTEAKLIKEDLGKLEKAEFDTDLQTNYDERYQLLLLIGILIALVEMALGERQTEGRIWKGRYEVQER